jgi:hypothetical protein
MKASQLWLEGALREIQNNPNSAAARMAKEIIARRRVDLNELQAGNIGARRDFLRQWVNDAQTSYRLMDNPVWNRTWWGRMIGQYQHWAYNATRMIMNETILPGYAALARGDPMLGARYLGRLMYWGAMAAGSEEVMKALKDWIFGREETAPSWGEFFNALHNNKNGFALKLAMDRLKDELISGSFLGMAGDYARWGFNYATNQGEVANTWNPNSPPAMSIVTSLFDLFNRFKVQGGKLSDKDIAQFVGNMSSGWREGKNMLFSANLALKQVTGTELPIPGFSEAKGYRERLFAQAKFRQFTNDPQGQEFRPHHGTSEPTPSTYYYNNIEDALYAGDIKRAKVLVGLMSKDPQAQHKNLRQALQESMTGKQPIPSGNASAAFLRWAQTTLPPEDLERIENAQNAFVKNAVEAGIFKPNAVRTHQVGAVKGRPSKRVLQLQL